MFIQVIEGRAKDPAGLKKQFEKWGEELQPGAEGFLGSTAGVSDDGTFITIARFENEDAARRNSDRAEQGEWWSETAGYLEGEPTFRNYTNSQTWMQGGSNDAGFVQVMQGRVKDIALARQMDESMESEMPNMRPDLIGGVAGYTDDGEYTSVAYFTSEAEARKGEQQEMPAEAAESMKQWMENMEGETRYIDLKDPWYR